MTDIIKIGDKEVGMTATGSSLILYKEFFKRDFLVESQKQPTDASVITDMGFIMAMQYAVGPFETSKKTRADYFEWCDQFAPMDLLTAGTDILNLWTKQAEAMSSPKPGAV